MLSSRGFGLQEDAKRQLDRLTRKCRKLVAVKKCALEDVRELYRCRSWEAGNQRNCLLCGSEPPVVNNFANSNVDLAARSHSIYDFAEHLIKENTNYRSTPLNSMFVSTRYLVVWREANSVCNSPREVARSVQHAVVQQLRALLLDVWKPLLLKLIIN